ncbi:anthranilate phosphoribosyltransferase [Paenibacillus sp. SC116]|uniref:anthranilate phosphoribosyltransferase n=1 Tax=Paenibacillus sp. SC116 TaxID=2968986 RepID=UPI00215AF92E|nr:anthranilate phosphoribosyltransferase [Paenibacillus sp. SC116]MCR8842956.1 anthranilate phosphoribosyltransferase [Paenibacillus sp. SC116]
MTNDYRVKEALSKLLSGDSLTREEARHVMEDIMRGDVTPAQIGALLAGLRLKGETVDEITGLAEGMRNAAKQVNTSREQLLDTCGTGGSGIHKLNVSTVSAIIAASSSVRVAKHGNRSASSRSGSADVLEALGVNIHLSSESAAECLDRIGICFMFAQMFHPAMKYAAAPRRELGIRTVFNMLGPLTNPAGADRQLLGIYDKTKTDTVAAVLRELGLKRAMVVSSLDGLDEISLSAPTRISELRDGDLRTYELTPEEMGLRTQSLSDVLGGEAADNAKIILDILKGERGAHRDIVLANAGACIYVSGQADSIREGVHIAADMIDTGKAYSKLQQLIETTGGMSHVS